jgi:branched-subunit amino acid transport protein
MAVDPVLIWTVIGVLAVGTFLIRFSFLGLIGDRPLPPIVVRLLRFTPVAVIPALVAPQVIWPSATDGQTDPIRLLAALTTLVVGMMTRKVLPAIVAGSAVLIIGLQLSAAG